MALRSRNAATCSRLVCWLLMAAAAVSAAPLARRDAGALACSLILGSDKVDLTPLTSTIRNSELTAIDQGQHYTYYLSICAPLVNSSAVAGCLAKNPGSQGCQTLLSTDAPDKRFPHNLGAGGQISPVGNSLLDGFEYKFTGGDLCHNTTLRSVSIFFSCGVTLGAPEFLSDDNCTYTFLWQSSAACVASSTPPPPPPPGQTTPAPPPAQLLCTTSDPVTRQAYDLSPLSGSVWTSTDIRQNSNYTYYISVCGALPNPPPANCSAGVAVCQTSARPFAPKGLGQPASPTVINGQLSLIYGNGLKCHSGATRKTQIDFACGQSGLGHPTFRIEDNCTYYFDWVTTAACPTAPATGIACSATDPTSGAVFDLSSLNTTWTLPGSNLSVAVCRPATVCGFGACTPGHSYGQASSQLAVLGATVSLVYRNGEPCPSAPQVNRSTTLLFVCDSSATNPASNLAMLLSDASSCAVSIEVRTALVCPQRQVECVATDPANHDTYDLSVLAIASPQWVVLGNGYTFLLGLCGPAGDAAPCPAGVAACQLKSSDASFEKSLGYALSAPTVVRPGVVQVVYTNGDACKNGAFNRSTILTLQCNETAGVGAPQYIAEHGNCSYEFLWVSALACPIQPAVGGQCSYQDSISGALVDLSPLKGKDARVTQGDTTYYVSVCGPIKYDLCDTLGACALEMGSDDTVKLDYGAASTVLTSTDQTLSLTYQSGRFCKTGTNYSSRIVFSCDPNAPPTAAPTIELLPSADTCVASFRWHTSLVCGSALPPTVDCVLRHNGLVYDLSPLMLASSNYLAFDMGTIGGNGYLYELNVCQQLAKDAGGTACPAGAAACQVPLGNSTHTPKSLGLPSSPVWDSQNGLTLVYANGTGLCKGSHQRSTVIHFVCPADGADQDPAFVSESPTDCTYTFEWATMAACPVKQIVGANCMLTAPTTNQRIDLAPLRAMGPQNVTDPSTGQTYQLQACAPLPKCNRSSTAGGCQKTTNGKTVNTGQANSDLMFDGGVATLQYTGGDACHSNAYNRSTTIHFVCDLNAGLGQPTFVIELGTCDYVFEWRTILTCPPVTPCRAATADGSKVYDLLPLSRTDRNWLASDARQGGKFAYEMNLCRAVVPRPGWQCSPFAGACQVVNSTAEADHTLGYLGQLSVETTPNGLSLLVATYKSGDSCHGGAYNRSARIEFTCPLDVTGKPQPGLVGEPEFLYEGTDCSYVFSWRTSAACPVGTFAPVVGSACAVTGDLLDRSYSLSSLANHVFNVTAGDYTYQLSVCGALSGPGVASGCAGAGACQLKAGQAPVVAGQPSSTVSFVNNAVVLNMTGGKPCHNNQYIRSTLITFLCGTDTIGTPQFAGESSTCEYSFVWYTAAACGVPSQTDCVAIDTDAGISYDFSALTRSNTNWVVFRDNDDDSYDVFELNICHSLVGQVSAACQGAAACLEHNNNMSGIAIGNVARPQVFEGIAYIEYDGGPCPHASGVNYTTYIMFTCSDNGFVGSPDIMEDDGDDCTYSFMWETVYACGPDSPTLPPASTSASTAVATTKAGSPYTGPSTTPAPSTTTPFVPLSGSQCLALGPDGLVDLTGLSYFNFTADCSDTDYTAANTCEQYTYVLSVCGYLDCGGHQASACQIPDEAGALRSMGLYVAPPAFVGSQLTLEYEHGALCHNQYQRRTRILFECDMAAGNGMPIFSAESADCVYTFEWRTAHACVPTALPNLDCTMEGIGYSFDLHVLGRRPGQQDWVVRGLPANETLTLNVCRHLQAWPGPACEGSAACLSAPSMNPAVLNLGYATAEPMVRTDGSIVLQYGLPDSYTLQMCEYGGSRSVVITFTCDEGSIGEPVLVDTLGDCVYYVSWATYAACNLQDTSKPLPGSQGNCTLFNAATGNVYDLTSLAGPTYVVNASGYSYHLAVCGPAAGCSVLPAGAGACQLGGKSNFSTGMATTGLRVTESGSLLLQYRGGTVCHRNTTEQTLRSTVIQFVCDRSATGPSTPVYSGESNCVYFFTWTTQAACAKTRDLECFVTDATSGKQYDLTPLKLFRGNWPIEAGAGSKYLFEMNVCRSINPTTDVFSACSAASGICQIENSNPNVTYSLGQPAAPTIVGGQLSIVYGLGDMCATPLGPRTATVQFVCPPGGVNTSFPLGRPRFVSEASTCHYQLQWETMAACPIPPPEVVTSCSVPIWNSVTGELYNVQALNRIYRTTDPTTGQLYIINPCATLGGNCSDNAQAHACQQATDSHWYSLGTLTQWTFADGVISLAITGGKPCHNSQAYRSTLITFSCDKNQDLGPLFMQETDNCVYQFNWPSPMACAYSPVLECGAHLASGAFVDLSSLSVGDGATTVQSPIGTFYVNVCSRAQHTGCAAEAGACLVQADGTALSLGQFRGEGPSWNGHAISLVYANGDRCPTGNHYSSTIRFVCGPARITVQQSSADPCAYIFEWSTCAACNGTDCVAPTAGPATSDPASPNTAGIAAGILVAGFVVGAVLVLFYRRPDLWDKVRTRVLAVLRRQPSSPGFKYSKVGVEAAGEGGSTTSLFGTGDDDNDNDDELMPM